MRSPRGYAPLTTSPEQDAVLDRVLDKAAAAASGSLAVLDLDGCLFDTRWRQVQILRELGSARGWPALYLPRPEHFIDWDLRGALGRAGLDPAWVDDHFDTVRQHWFERFFSADAVGFDHALPGAAVLVRRLARHLGIVYLTGRHEDQRGHTLRALERFGFPVDGTRLELQAANAHDYTGFKDQALRHIAQIGQPVIFFDNEPANANLFRDRFPDALVVFVETDRSDDPLLPHAEIPWIRGFLWQTSSDSAPPTSA